MHTHVSFPLPSIFLFFHFHTSTSFILLLPTYLPPSSPTSPPVSSQPLTTSVSVIVTQLNIVNIRINTIAIAIASAGSARHLALPIVELNLMARFWHFASGRVQILIFSFAGHYFIRLVLGVFNFASVCQPGLMLFYGSLCRGTQAENKTNPTKNQKKKKQTKAKHKKKKKKKESMQSVR